MKTSDLTLSIIIILFFIGLYFFNIFIVGVAHIKDNWPVYRCQPMIMPFASWFGKDTSENFSFCIQNIQIGSLGNLLGPINLNMNILKHITSKFTDDLNKARAFMSVFRFNLRGIFGNVFATMFNIMVEIQRMIINIKDVIAKMIGIIMTTLFIVKGSIMTMQSMWNGPPGKLVRALCFDPETKVKLKNGEIFEMKDIPLNSILPNGSRVCAVMQISNLDENKNYIEKMYKVKRNNGDAILVSGSHLIYDAKVEQFIHVKDLLSAETTETNCEVLSCLITSDHTIQIGEWIFHDWEDSNGSEPKNIGKKE
jgi:hypothetical protein